MGGQETSCALFSNSSHKNNSRYRSITSSTTLQVPNLYGTFVLTSLGLAVEAQLDHA